MLCCWLNLAESENYVYRGIICEESLFVLNTTLRAMPHVEFFSSQLNKVTRSTCEFICSNVYYSTCRWGTPLAKFKGGDLLSQFWNLQKLGFLFVTDCLTFVFENTIKWRNHIEYSFVSDSIFCGFSAFILSPANQSCLLTSYTSYRADLGDDCGKPNGMRFEFYRRTRKTSLFFEDFSKIMFEKFQI